MDSIGAGLWPPWLSRRERLLTEARRQLGNLETSTLRETTAVILADTQLLQAGPAPKQRTHRPSVAATHIPCMLDALGVPPGTAASSGFRLGFAGA
jgi:hypothetical protein